MLAAARRAFELEGQRDSMWRVTVHVQLGWALALAGRSDEARPLLERGAALAPRTEQWLNAVGAYCLLAFLDLEAGDLASAERRARRAVGVVESHGLADTATGSWARARWGRCSLAGTTTQVSAYSGHACRSGRSGAVFSCPTTRCIRTSGRSIASSGSRRASMPSRTPASKGSCGTPPENHLGESPSG